MEGSTGGSSRRKTMLLRTAKNDKSVEVGGKLTEWRPIRLDPAFESGRWTRGNGWSQYKNVLMKVGGGGGETFHT